MEADAVANSNERKNLVLFLYFYSMVRAVFCFPMFVFLPPPLPSPTPPPTSAAAEFKLEIIELESLRTEESLSETNFGTEQMTLKWFWSLYMYSELFKRLICAVS
jgi:hypothetical protein